MEPQVRHVYAGVADTASKHRPRHQSQQRPHEDHSKGNMCGDSPGYGISLVAETAAEPHAGMSFCCA